MKYSPIYLWRRKMKIKIEYLENYSKDWPKMTYAHAGDSCLDMRAAIASPLVLKAHQRAVVPTGIKCELIKEDNDWVEIQVRARSGLAAKHGISMVNGIGTIDFSYRGEIGAIMINHAEEDLVINPGDRIAQMAICPIYKPEIIEATISENTDRSSGGFGSSGKK